MAKAKKEDVAEVKEEIIDGPTEEVSTTPNEADNKEQVKEAKTAKAGKRSAKALKEAEELAEKEERKAAAKTEEDAAPVAGPAPKTRSLLERRGKKYREAHKVIEADKLYSLEEATALVPKISTTKFDGSVELHIRLGVDPRQADQNIRQTLVLPHGSGKTVRIAVFAEADQHADAKKAGADVVGAEEFLQQLDKEKIDFDVLIATPSLMAKLGKYARLLGPKGLMPNPKSGTVTKDIAKAVTEAKGGRVEYRVDSTGIVHIAIGKVSFSAENLVKNAEAVFASVRAAKPASIKGNYMISAHLTTTMGPSLPLSI